MKHFLEIFALLGVIMSGLIVCYDSLRFASAGTGQPNTLLMTVCFVLSVISIGLGLAALMF